MIDVAAWTLVVIALAIAAGAIVQSVVGIGLGLVSAPIIALVAPELMPGTLLALGLALPLATLMRSGSDIHWHGFVWAMPGRLVGTALGAWVVAVVSARTLGVAVGLVVLLAVVLTARAVTVPITRTSLNVAGFTSGVVGTTSAIGGPPMALLYQRRPPAQMRSTMAVFFVAGTSLSLLGLALSGNLPRQQMAVGALMLPALLMGAATGEWGQRRLPVERVRPLVLVVSAASAVVLIVRSLS